MREQSAILKGKARALLHGNYAPVIISILILLLCFALASSPFNYSLLISQRSSALIIYIIANILIMLVLYAFAVGIIYMALKISRGGRGYVMDLLFAFRNKPDRFIIVFLARELIFFICLLPTYAISFIQVTYSNILWINLANIILTFLGIIVGLLISAPLMLTEFILIENPSIKGLEGMKLSSQLLKGRIGQLIYIMVSFVGYYILSMISFNIGFLWTIPYTLVTLACLYDSLKGAVV